MKKLLVICLALIMVLSASAAVFAAPGFVPSPSKEKAPQAITFTPKDEDCTAKLVITPHEEKKDLPEALEKLMDTAYTTVKGSGDLTKLNEDLKKIAADAGISSDKLAISDLFDIHVTGCDFHEGHTDFDITLSADLLEHFVGLLHMNKDGKWELVKDAKVTGNGDHLAFSVESFSPFAIVVDTTDLGGEAQTGDNSNIYLYLAIMTLSAIALVVIWRKVRKQSV